MPHYFLAVDIGAESGRIILGSLIRDRLIMKEIHRFANGILQIRDKCYWNIGNIFNEIVKGLEICVFKEGVQPQSIGIDTWGVDFGLLTKDGTLLGLPYAYRDSRTHGAIESFTSLISKEELYKLTGTQCVSYNTAFQLHAAKRHHTEIIDGAADLLFIPDLLAYFLTGEKKTERSFATTTQLYNPVNRSWEEKIFKVLHVPISIMQDIVTAGSPIGYIDNRVCKQTGINQVPVIAVATHDTNSAIGAIPAQGDNWAFISSGTWSLVGVERPYPIVSEAAFRMNFSNEAGVFNSFNILKNHMGLWLVQQCKKVWKNKDYSYDMLIEMAAQADEFVSFIDVDDINFLNPDDMCEAIAQYCRKTNQRVCADEGQIIRVILESLAFKYRETIEQIIELTGISIDEIYITGGGVKNQLLLQFTANATGRIVKAVLAEGASAGNILMQAFGMGYVHSHAEIRKIINDSYNGSVFLPVDILRWENAFNSYRRTIQSSSKR